jgi:hypothetical protein
MLWKLLWKEILGLRWHWKLRLNLKFPWHIFGIGWWKIVWYCGHTVTCSTPAAGVTDSVFEYDSLWASNRLLSTIVRVYSLLTGGWPHCRIVGWTLLATEYKRRSGNIFIQLGYVLACVLLWTCLACVLMWTCQCKLLF